MRIFHVSAYEGQASISHVVYSYPPLSNLFGTVEYLDISGYASQVSGSPTLQIQEEVSLDNENWTGGSIVVGMIPITLNTSADTLFQGADLEADLYAFGKPAFVRLKMIIGTSGSALLRVWVTGRDRSRRAHPLAGTR